MKLIVISDPDFINGEANILNSLFGQGLKYLHLRKPDCSSNELRSLINGINPSYHKYIALHQHHFLAADFGISRIHFTEKQRQQTNNEVLQKWKDGGYMLSTSIHNLTDLNNLSAVFDYSFYGPVFDSISKTDYNGILDEYFYLATAQKKVNVIAVGGIDNANLEKIRKMNFDGAAVLGALWKEPAMADQVFAGLCSAWA